MSQICNAQICSVIEQLHNSKGAEKLGKLTTNWIETRDFIALTRLSSSPSGYVQTLIQKQGGVIRCSCGTFLEPLRSKEHGIHSWSCKPCAKCSAENSSLSNESDQFSCQEHSLPLLLPSFAGNSPKHCYKILHMKGMTMLSSVKNNKEFKWLAFELFTTSFFF